MTTTPDLGARGADFLQQVIAIDSHSDEKSETIPSTEGQRVLGRFLGGFFEARGFSVSFDASANLIAEKRGTGGPKLALMIHMDTAQGTAAVDRLQRLPGWTGARIPYPQNHKLEVTAAHYPETEAYVGQDLLFGPGTAPIGLDDKLGLCQMMTLADVLHQEPGRPHPDLILVCRPDEEIGRMAAVVGLAETLAQKEVRHGYTLDGLAPFEINTENFNGARATVRIDGAARALPPLPVERAVTLLVHGAKSHGATAKAEGYLNATVVFARALAPMSRRTDIVPLSFQSDPLAETSARITFVVRGEHEADVDQKQQVLLDAFSTVLAPAAFRGAEVTVERQAPFTGPFTDQGMRLFAHLATFLRTTGPSPLLSEDSDGYGGYSNPCFVEAEGDTLRLEYRLRDFDPAALAARKAHVEQVAAEGPGPMPVVITDQYENMGPAMAGCPELAAWAEKAAQRAEVPAVRQPIRGSTGVDPFLAQGTFVANLGTGYFAPESEKEFTSVQMIERHVRWLLELVEVVAREPVS